MPKAIDSKERIPKIHFAALFGIAVDADLLDYWIPHYKALHFDSYTIFLHKSENEPLNIDVEARFINEGFLVTMIPENALRVNPITPGAPDGVRSILLELLSLAIPEGDFIVTADADEFQIWTEKPHDVVNRGVGLVLGTLIDCFDESLHAPDPKKSLAENYPIEYLNLSSLWRDMPYKTAKVCMSPARYPLDFSGSHEPKRHYHNVLPRVIATGPITVLHYRWRASAFQRVSGRSYWPEHELAFVRQFFGLETVHA
jgi:hypothetical protein